MQKLLKCLGLMAGLFLFSVQTGLGQPGEEPKETELNTASLTSADGKIFKLVLIGDCLPQLSINGEKISKDDLPFYEEQIDKLTGIIAFRREKAMERINAARSRTMEQLMGDIVNKKIVIKKTDIKSYYLTAGRMMINGKLQDPDTFVFFRNRYIKSEDAVLYYERRGDYTFQKP